MHAVRSKIMRQGKEEWRRKRMRERENVCITVRMYSSSRLLLDTVLKHIPESEDTAKSQTSTRKKGLFQRERERERERETEEWVDR